MDEQGILKFFKFIAFVKAYGKGQFASTVNQALRNFAQKINAAGLIMK